MSGWRKNATAEHSHHLRGLQPGVCETDELPLCAQPSIASLQHHPEETVAYQRFVFVLYPTHHFGGDGEIRWKANNYPKVSVKQIKTVF